MVGERDDTVVEGTESSVYYSMYPATESSGAEWVDGNPVNPLSETIDYMQAYRWNFEPALEVVADEYYVDLDVHRLDYIPEQ